MRPKAQILLYGDSDESILRLILETRLHVKVTSASSGIGAVAAMHQRYFHCAVMIQENQELINFLRAREVPSLGIGPSPSFADSAVSGEYMGDLVEAVRLACVRRRGPRKAAA